MTIDQQAEHLKVQPIPDNQREALSHGDILWQDAKTKIYYPENPLVPSSEGIHLRVESPGVPLHPKTPEEWKGWLDHWAKMIGAAKVVSEGADLPDLWQSLIGSSEYTPGDHLVTDIIGRNPHGKSWTAQGLETAPLPDPNYDNRKNRVDNKVVEHLGKVVSRYFESVWLPSMKNVEVFPNRLNVHPPGSPEFKFVYDRNTQLPWPDPSEPLFVADEAEAIAILVPHLKTGIHIMIGVPDSPKRPWHNLQKTLEGFVISEAAGQVLESQEYEGLPLAADYSIRATGSWYGGFKDVFGDSILKKAIFGDEKEGPKPPKWIKRRQKGIATQIDKEEIEAKGKDYKGHLWTMGMLGFHPHIYAARYPDELIRLARRPAKEHGQDWEGIEVMDEKKRLFMRDVLNENMPQIINQAAHSLK